MKNFKLLRATDLLCRARDSQDKIRMFRVIEKTRHLFEEDEHSDYESLVEEVKAGQHEKVRRYALDQASFDVLASKFGTYTAGGCRELNESAHRFLKEHELELKAVVFWGDYDYATETIFLGQAPCSKKIEHLLGM